MFNPVIASTYSLKRSTSIDSQETLVGLSDTVIKCNSSKVEKFIEQEKVSFGRSVVRGNLDSAFTSLSDHRWLCSHSFSTLSSFYLRSSHRFLMTLWDLSSQEAPPLTNYQSQPTSTRTALPRAANQTATLPFLQPTLLIANQSSLLHGRLLVWIFPASQKHNCPIALRKS